MSSTQSKGTVGELKKKEKISFDLVTYVKRAEHLSRVLTNGRYISRKIVLPTKGEKKRVNNQEHKEQNKKLRVPLQLWRIQNGLTANDGFVKKYTKVLFDDTRYLQSFDSHPFFRSVPYACVRKTNGKQLFEELRYLEKHIINMLSSSNKNYTEHKYGANEGVNCGLSFAGSGTLSNKQNGISGTVQWSGFIKRRPEL